MSTSIQYILPGTPATHKKPGLSIKEFPSTEHANVASVWLDKPYPATGHALNTECEMHVYILEGELETNEDGEKKFLSSGSLVIVPKNAPYKWTPCQFVKMLIFSTPPWTPEQSRHIPE